MKINVLLLLALVAPAAAAVILEGVRRRRRWRDLVGLYGKESLPPLRPVRHGIGRAATVAAYALALTPLLAVGERRDTTGAGTAALIVVDVSASMQCRDVAPTRLEQARREAATLARSWQGGRIGLLAFAGRPVLLSPPEQSRNHLQQALERLTPDTVPTQGTAIGAALDEASAILAHEETLQGRKTIILLSDGEDLAGDPVAAARRAAKSGITVSALGIGTGDGGLVPQETGFIRDGKGRYVRSTLDEGLLRQIAAETGGRYAGNASAFFSSPQLSPGQELVDREGLPLPSVLAVTAAIVLLLVELLLQVRRTS